MKEKIAKILHIDANESKQLGENIDKILSDYYKEIELAVLMPSQIFKGAVSLHKALLPTNKISAATISTMEKLSKELDERRKEALKKEEEAKKAAENQKIEVAVQTTSKETSDKSETKNAPEKLANDQISVEEIEPAIDFQDVLHFLSDKSPAFKVTALKYLLTHKKLATFRSELRKLLNQAVEKSFARVSLFETIIQKKNEGLTLSEILKQSVFIDLLEEFSQVAKKMDIVGTDDKQAFLKQFLHQFKSETQRQYELLCLLITHKQCKNPNVKKLLEELYKKWPQKNDKKDERIIVEITKRYLDLL